MTTVREAMVRGMSPATDDSEPGMANSVKEVAA